MALQRSSTWDAEPTSGQRGGSALPITIELLGAFHVRVGDQEISADAWRLQKARSLVKLLALTEGRRLPRDRVLDLLWPDLDPDAANNNLHQALHRARRAFGTLDGALTLRGGVVALLPDSTPWIDVDAFETEVAEARATEDLARYHRAIELYTGDLLPDDLYEDWAIGPRERLRELYISTLIGVARRHESRGEVGAALDLLNRAVTVDPLREEAHAELIRLYASTGQRSRALRQYRQLKDALEAELEAEPDIESRTMREVIASGRYGDADADPLEKATETPQHNVPLALTSFIGRRGELQDVEGMLRGARLLTIVGVGGSGKTRLALRAGWAMLSTYSDGVWVVSLSSLSAADQVPRAVAEAIGMEIDSPLGITESIVERLRGARALLILDNCEHLLDACRDLALQILTRCPEVQLLATSRTRLGIAGEMTFTLPPFACPPADPLPPNELLTYDAIELFVERARLRRPSFALTPVTAPAVQRVVRAVDGIPLAVELAASRVGTLGVEAIADRLAASTEVLSTRDAGIEERHHSLDATLDWSYSLLDEDEAGFFRALAVFRGGWPVEEVERFAGPEVAVLDMLGRLADNSLVTVEGAGGGAVRYRLLEPVRHYAQRLLREANDEPAARARHAAVYAEVAREAESHLRGPDAADWFRRLDDEHANLRAALAWCLDEPEGAEIGLRIVGSIWRYWFARGLLDEGRDVTRRLLERAGGDARIDAVVRAAAYNAAGAMAYYQSDEEEAHAMYLQALALRREAGDARGVAATLSNLGLVCKDRGNRDEAITYFTESRDIFEELQDDRGLCSTLGNIGILYQEHGEFERALPLQERSLALARSIRGSVMTSLNNLAALFVELEQWDRARELLEESLAESSEHGVKRSQAAALVNLGHVHRATGEIDRAFAASREALVIGRDQGETMMVALALEAIATCLADIGDGISAATLLATAARMRREAGTPPSPVEQRRLDRTFAAIERSTGAAERDIHPLGDDEAIALALGESQARPAI